MHTFAQKVAIVVLLKSYIFIFTPKAPRHLGFFCTKSCPRTILKKSPNLVTLLTATKHIAIFQHCIVTL